MNVKKTSVILFSLLSVFSLASCSMFKNLFHHDDDVEFNYKNFDNWNYAYSLYKEDGFYIETASIKTYEGNVYEIPKDESIPNIILVSNYDYVYASYKIYNPNKYEIIGLVFQGNYAIQKTDNISVNRITSNIREGDYTIVEALFDRENITGPIYMEVLAKWSDKYFRHRAERDEYNNLFRLNCSIFRPDNIEYEFVKKGGYIDQDGIKINRLNSFEHRHLEGLLYENLHFSEVSYIPGGKNMRIVGASGIMNNSKVLKIDKLIVPYNFLINSFEGIEIENFAFSWTKDSAIDDDNLITHVFSNPYANFDKAYLKEDGGCYLRTRARITEGHSKNNLYYCLNEIDKAYTGQDIKVNSSTIIIGGRSGIFERQYNSIMIPKSLQYYCRSFFDTYIFDNIYYEGTLREFRARRPVEYNNDKPSSKYLDESNPKLYFYSEGEPPLGSPYHFYHYNAEGGIERYVGYEV